MICKRGMLVKIFYFKGVGCLLSMNMYLHIVSKAEDLCVVYWGVHLLRVIIFSSPYLENFVFKAGENSLTKAIKNF